MNNRNIRTIAWLRALLLPAVRPADLARAAGVSQQYVSAVLAGTRPPSDRLLRAAQQLGLPVHSTDEVEDVES